MTKATRVGKPSPLRPWVVPCLPCRCNHKTMALTTPLPRLASSRVRQKPCRSRLRPVPCRTWMMTWRKRRKRSAVKLQHIRKNWRSKIMTKWWQRPDLSKNVRQLATPPSRSGNNHARAKSNYANRTMKSTRDSSIRDAKKSVVVKILGSAWPRTVTWLHRVSPLEERTRLAWNKQC